ncbi:hypothetical protein [Thalassotalea fusca]
MLKSLIKNLMITTLGILLLLNVSFATNAAQFNFCYEQQEFLPHFRSSSIELPKEKPGAAIEIIQHIDNQLPQLNISFKRDNWSRCLKGLKTGKVSGVLGSYSTAREKYGHFPMKDNKLDTDRAFSKISVCLFHFANENISWDGKSIKFDSPLIVSIPRGYHTIEKLKALNLDIYQTDTTERAHNLLLNRKVTASVAQCDFANFPDDIVPMLPPLRQDYGFIIISSKFYRANPELSEAIWNELAKTDQQLFYDKYQWTK